MPEQTVPSYRHELKYLISSAQAAVLYSRLKYLMRPDSHTDEKGRYWIRSLYFDDDEDRCFWENENGVDPREKYRIRIYNHSLDRIMLERKRKERQMTLKTSCPLSPEVVRKVIEGEVLVPDRRQPPLLRLLAANMQTRRFHPVVIVEYERIPFVHPLGNVRVTLDLHISSSNCFARFFDETIPKRPVMGPGQQFLEVKYDQFLPDVLYRSLQMDNLQRATYSKFYYCRKFQWN